jgi:cell volume regulation protein A
LLITLVLILVARPVAVYLSLLPFRFPWREQVFISWVGLRGAVPIILAIFPLTAGLPYAWEFFNLAFFVVLVSLVIQGWTVTPLARRLALDVPPTGEPMQRITLDIPGHLEREIVCYQVLEGSTASKKAVANLSLPEGSRIISLIRGDEAMQGDSLVLLPGDLVYLFSRPDAVPQLNRLFDPHRVPERLGEHRYFGEFVLDGGATLSEVAGVYALEVDGSVQQRTVAEHFAQLFRRRPVVGDRAPLGTAELVVREIQAGKVAKAGIRLVPVREELSFRWWDRKK